MRFATRACSADTAAACCWSSQKPGCASSCSSSASRVLSRSGSKVTTDPVELGPDPFELLLKREFLVGHGGGAWYRRTPTTWRSLPSVHRLTKAQARRIAVRAQLLDAPRPPDLL